MSDTLSIYEAKTNLSKLVKRAKKGETIYVGAYGKPDAIIAPIPKDTIVQFGSMSKEIGHLDDVLFVGSDPEIQELFYGKDWDQE